MNRERPAALAVALMRTALAAADRSKREGPFAVGLRSNWNQSKQGHAVVLLKIAFDGLELYGENGVVDKLHVIDMPNDPESLRAIRTAALSAYCGETQHLEEIFDLPPGSVVASLSSVAQLFTATETVARLNALQS